MHMEKRVIKGTRRRHSDALKLELVERSLMLCTALAPKIGYDASAKLAQEAYKTGKTVRQLAREKKLLPEDQLERALDPWRMTRPQ